MGRKVVELNGIPCCLDITLSTNDYINIELYAKSLEYENTAYTMRWHRYKGIKTFRIMLPIAPQKVEIVARERGTGKENKVSIRSIEKKHLPTKYQYLRNKSPYLNEFLEHAQSFCERASYLPVGQYNSNNGNIKIKYCDALYVEDGNGGKFESSTPCRVDANTKEIEVNRKYFRKYSVAGRMALLLHEFSHVFINKNKSDEFEADKNSAQIYLGLGFPRVDLLNAWIMCYGNSDNDFNRQRLNRFFEYVYSLG